MSPAAERLKYILGDDEDAIPTPTLFTEMDTLQHEGDELEWRESARYQHATAHTHTVIIPIHSRDLRDVFFSLRDGLK